jgi:hypothetical protein
MIKAKIERISWVKETIAGLAFGGTRRYSYERVGEEGQRGKDISNSKLEGKKGYKVIEGKGTIVDEFQS